MARITRQAHPSKRRRRRPPTYNQRADRTLLERHRWLYAILDSNPAIVFVKDLKGRYLYTNSQFQALLPFGPGQVIGRTDEDLFPPDQASAFRENDRKVIKSGLPMRFEEVAQHAGGPHTSIVTKFPLRTRNGRIYAICGIVTDITDRKRVEAELRQSEERFRAVAETANDAVVSADEHGDIAYWNHGAERMFGYAAAEALGKPLTLLMPERYQTAHSRGLQRYLDTGVAHILGRTIEMAGRRKSGAEFPLELSLAAWKTREGSFFTGIMRDISERKRAEVELRELSGRLLHSQDEERRRIARELHDSTGPALAGLLARLHVVRDRVKDLDPETSEALSYSLALAEHTAREIRKLSERLRPVVLDEAGLESAIRWYADGFAARTGIRVDLDLPRASERWPRAIETTLFGILQEFLPYLHLHSGNRTAAVRLRSGVQEYTLEATDSAGAPSDWPHSDKSPLTNRLAGLGEQIRVLGGKLAVCTEPAIALRAIVPKRSG